MALSSIPVPPDPGRDERAAELVDQVPTWPLFTLKQPWGSFEPGTVFRRAYGSCGKRYLVNSVACQCPDYAEAGFVCKHIRAHVLWEQRQLAERGARQVAGREHASEGGPTSWRHCSRKCGALLPPEHLTLMCDRCFERIARMLDVIE